MFDVVQTCSITFDNAHQCSVKIVCVIKTSLKFGTA